MTNVLFRRAFWPLLLSVGTLGLGVSCANALPLVQASPAADEAANGAIGPPPGDHISQGLWWLYHLQYDNARESFAAFTRSHPENPLGYFYKTANGWWQLAQDIELEQPEVLAQFENDYEETIRIARMSYERSETEEAKALALLCEGGAMGLHGRWHVTQSNWRKAYALGTKGYRLLERAVSQDPDLIDAYLGLGIYDYYTATLPGIRGFLVRFVMGGNKARGIAYLYRTKNHGTYARVEATLFLIQIYTTFEDEPEKALQLVRSLRDEYPLSSVMHAATISAHYALNNWEEGLREAADFINKCRRPAPFYSEAHLNTGYYYAGKGALFGKGDAATCLSYVNRIITQEDRPSQWASFAHLLRGHAYDALNRRELALADYRTVLARKNVWGTHQAAAESLRRPFSLEKESGYEAKFGVLEENIQHHSGLK